MCVCTFIVYLCACTYMYMICSCYYISSVYHASLSVCLSILIELKSLIMQGIQVHLECPVDDIKYLGMAAGEYLMNLLHSPSSSSSPSPSSSSSSSFTPLSFTYPQSESIKWLKSFMRPASEQVKNLHTKRHSHMFVHAARLYVMSFFTFYYRRKVSLHWWSLHY